MKEDKVYKELLKETVVHSAPTDFTASVMKELRTVRTSSSYKPLISPLGQILIGAFVILLTIIGITTGNGNDEPAVLERWLSNVHFDLPVIDTGYMLPALAILAAVFLLIFADARYQRRKYSLD